MSGFDWSPGGCCCFGYLDVYIHDSNGGDLFRAQSIYPSSNIDLAASEAQWEIPRASSGYRGIDNCVVATNEGYLLEVLEVVADVDSKRIQVYDTAAKTIVLSEDFDVGTSDIVELNLSADGAGSVSIRHSTSRTYKNWDNAFTFETRGAFTEAVRSTNFHPLIADYSDAGVLDGSTAIPLAVSRWNYPRCIGYKITSFDPAGWENKNETTFPFAAYWGTDYEMTYQCVTGNVDWTVDGPPVIDDDTVWFTQTVSGIARGDSGDSDATNNARALLALVEMITGNTGLFVGGTEWRWGTSPYQTSVTSGIRPRSPIGGENVGHSPIKGNQGAANGPITVFESTENGGCESAVIRLWDHDAATLSVAFYIDGTSELDVTTTRINSLTPINSPSHSFAFVFSNTAASPDEQTLYVYDNAGNLDWSQLLDNGNSQPAFVVGCSDRYIYVHNAIRDRAAVIGGNLPAFTGGTHSPNDGADTWNSWLVSLDGTRWVPSRYVAGDGDFEETLDDAGYMKTGDVIKDSTIIPLCPPDSWF